MSNKIRKLTYIALLTALSTALVLFPRIGIPMLAAQGGIVHLGDSIIYITAIFFGPLAGAVAGGIGHSFANLISGSAQFAPFTLVIKALMGFAVGLIAYKQTVKSFRLWIAFICALIILTAGYFIAVTVLIGFEVALSAVGFDVFQWTASVVVTLALLPIVNKILRRNEI